MNQSPAALALAQVGYALLEPQQFARELDIDLARLESLRPTWSNLPRDTYLRDGGRYRSRRHSCFVQDLGAGVREVPREALGVDRPGVDQGFDHVPGDSRHGRGHS